MKVLIAVFLTIISLSAQAQTMSVMQSGINWKASNLVVKAFQPSHSSHRENFKCFEQKYADLPIKQNLYDLGFNNPDNGPLTLKQTLENQSCFQQAGWYEIVLQMEDYAENKSEYDLILTVVPSDLSLSDSTLKPIASDTSGSALTDITERLTCSSPTLVADGEDQCILELQLRDRFGNVIKPDGVNGQLTINLPEKTELPRLDATKDLYKTFLAGLYFQNNQKQLSFNFPADESKLKFGLKSYLPTLEAVKDEASTVVVKAQPINFDLAYRLSQKQEDPTTAVKTVTPLFSPWVNVIAAQSGSIENFVLLPLNRMVNIPLELSSLVSKDLPTRVSLDWEAPETENLWVRFADEKTNEPQDSLRALVPIRQTPQPFDLKLNLMQPESVNSQSNFTLEPIITYLHDVAGTKKLVRYPLNVIKGKNLEPIPPFNLLRLEADIEGRVLADGAKSSDGALILSGADKTLFTLWREQVSRQAISLIRGQAPKTETTFNMSQDFGDKNIAYFKGVNLTLKSDEETGPMVFNDGVKTLIVEDGNLHIPRNLTYGSPEDSLGIIVINTKPNDSERGHVFVHQNVQNIVGSYFLDGALVSTQKLSDPAITDTITNREQTSNQSAAAPLALQLVLEGTIVSRNTIGGADETPAQGPNNQKLRRELALIYDLNYLRRYEPLFDENGNRQPDSANQFCFKPNGKNCYPNPAPTVIVYDARVQLLPPPGFEPSQ